MSDALQFLVDWINRPSLFLSAFSRNITMHASAAGAAAAAAASRCHAHQAIVSVLPRKSEISTRCTRCKTANTCGLFD